MQHNGNKLIVDGKTREDNQQLIYIFIGKPQFQLLHQRHTCSETKFD